MSCVLRACRATRVIQYRQDRTHSVPDVSQLDLRRDVGESGEKLQPGHSLLNVMLTIFLLLLGRGE